MQTALAEVELNRPDRKFCDRVAPWLAFVAVLIATAMIANTYRIFNQTWDEPLHIACGMEWLDKGVYQYETLHPPLARVAVALGPYLAGLRSHGAESMLTEGNLILTSNGQYQKKLTLARIGVLPFFWLCSGLIWYITRKFMGPACALTSVFLFTTIPAVLAHSSLATTDLPVTAIFLLALTAWLRWREESSLANSICLGMAVGLALVTKFSAIPFLGLTLAVVIATERPTLGQVRRLTRQILVICGFAALMIWAAYRFSWGPALQPGMESRTLNRIVGESGRLHNAAQCALHKLPLPAPGFSDGIRSLGLQNRNGRKAYFLGQVSTNGHWYFFPVLLTTKLPIPLLLLIGIGAVRALFPRREEHRGFLRLVLFATVCPLFIGCSSTINLGLRHVLVIFPFLAILAGVGAYELWTGMHRLVLRRIGAVALIACNAASCWSVTPDFLPYFNELSRRHASFIVADSDLDWGQDLSRLCTTLAQRKDISHLFLAYNGTADLSKFALPPWSELPPFTQSKGWIAISVFKLKTNPDRYGWLEHYHPVQTVGKSILLYYIE